MDPTQSTTGEQKEMNSILPPEMINCISHYLDTRDFLSLRSTCKDYYRALTDNVIVKLLPRQVSHYFRMKDAFRDNIERGCPVVVDCSIMGSGKTYVSCALCVELKLEPIVFCPKTAKSVWFDAFQVFGLTGEVETYARLRGRNRYLVNGQATAEWEQKVKNGVMLIYDECQNLKNATAQFKCALALATAIYDQNRSCMLMLSATPADKLEQVVRYCRLLGIMRNDQIAHQNLQTGEYVLDGFREIINFCVKDQNKREILVESVNKATKHHVLMTLFTKYIKSIFFFAMKPPEIDAELDIKNGFYKMSVKGQEELREAVDRLRRAIAVFMSMSQRRSSTMAFRDIGLSIAGIEKAKLEIFCRQALLALNDREKPNQKVICMFSHLTPIFVLAKVLQAYNPLVLTGKNTDSQRQAVMHYFKHSPNHRLLIGNITVMALGISLHDTIGDSPRVCLISPSYHVMNLHQASRRAYREGSKSDTIVRYVYGSDQMAECSMLNSIAKKCSVMRTLTTQAVGENVKYPSEHEKYIES